MRLTWKKRAVPAASTTVAFDDEFTLAVVVATPDGVENVRITVAHSNPRAAMAAMYQVVQPEYLGQLADIVGAEFPDDDA